LNLRSSQSYERFYLQNRLNNTYEDIYGLPIVNWKYLVQTLRPNKEESKIEILLKKRLFIKTKTNLSINFSFSFFIFH